MLADQNKKNTDPFGAIIAVPSDNANAEDKQVMLKIRKKVSEELVVGWKQSNVKAQIFPFVMQSLHPEVLDFLLSAKNVETYDVIAKRANLNPLQRDLLPQLIWQCVISKNLNQLEMLVKQKIQTQSALQALVLQLLNDQILNNVRALAQKPLPKMQAPGQVVEQDKKQHMTLSQALEKFPRIGEQLLSTDYLKLNFFPEPARPSVKNWITDYHQTTGNALKHDVIERGNYLFHSENGKKLNSVDRQKVTIVLKALDENSQLSIDSLKQEIVFEISNEPVITRQQNLPAKEDEEPLDFADRGLGKFAPDKNPKFEHFFQPKNLEEKPLEPKQEPEQDIPVREDYSAPNFSELIKNPKTEPIKQAPVNPNINWKPVESKLEQSEKILTGKTGFGTDSFYGNQQNEPDIIKEKINVSEENIKFVSPQKLPIEQNKQQFFQKELAKELDQKDFQLQEKEISRVSEITNTQTTSDAIVEAALKKTAQQQQSVPLYKSQIPHRITPMGSIQADADASDPRVVGNTVDLKG